MRHRQAVMNPERVVLANDGNADRKQQEGNKGDARNRY